MDNIMQQQRIPQNIIVTPFDPVCAWCRYAQCLPQGDGSHCICANHAELVEEEAMVRRFQRTPSYFERFKDGREAF